jgi:hypothetical protein
MQSSSQASKVLTVCLNSHREGELWPRSFRSVLHALEMFDATGENWELLILADRCDTLTNQLIEESVRDSQSRYRNIKIVTATVGDLGLSRNLAAEQAQGEFLAFVDADDFVSANWLVAGVRAARANPGVFFHPECNVYFGQHSAIFLHRDSDTYDLRTLFFHNLWSALSLGPTALYRAHPYHRNDIHLGFGYEDWFWHGQTLAQGRTHRPVPETCHIVRLKAASLSSASSQNECVIRAVELWDRLRVPIDTTHRTALSTLLDLDPWEVASTDLPAWLLADVRAAQSLDSSIQLAPRLINFSPFYRNQYLPAFPSWLAPRITAGLAHIRLGAGIEIPSHDEQPDLLLAEKAPTQPGRVLNSAELRSVLGRKYNHFIAMLVVQSRCSWLEVTESAEIDVLRTHCRPLRHTLTRLTIAADDLSEETLTELEKLYGPILSRYTRADRR